MMWRWIRIAVPTLAALTAVAAERWVSFDVIDARDAESDLAGLSEIGRRIVRKPSTWTIGRSDHFTVLADSVPDLSRAFDDAEHTRRTMVELLDAGASPTRYLLVFVKEDDLWSRAVTRQGLRPDSLALQTGRETYFKDDPSQRARPDRVAHEVIHLCLASAFTNGVPLWLDEGLAGYYGWKCAAEVGATRDVRLFRERQPLNEDDLITLEQLLGLPGYPADEQAARNFYRQSEELIAALEHRLGTDGMRRFIRAASAAHIMSVEDFFHATGLVGGEQHDIMEDMRRRCIAPAVFED